MFPCVWLTALHKYLEMADNQYENDHSFETMSKKRQIPMHQIEFAQPHRKRMKCMRMQKIQEKRRKREEQDSFHIRETALKRHCLNI